MCAVGRFIHPMAFLQQFKQLLHWDARVRWAAQGENLPQQHPVRPPEMQESQYDTSITGNETDTAMPFNVY